LRQLTKQEIKRTITKQYKREKENAAGVRRMYLTGISQKPPFGKELQQASRQKENSVEWMYKETPGEVISSLKSQGFTILAIELTDDAVENLNLSDYLKGKDKVCFIAGSEVYGVSKSTLEKCDKSILIPMYGKGASLNVSTSVGVVLFSF
jgi:23S rRNA (guanosine2251-2'-O)-methyltransferase